MKKILFITSTRIGDAVLSMGILKHLEIKYKTEGIDVTVACGALVKSFFEGVPFVSQIIPLKKEKYNIHLSNNLDFLVTFYPSSTKPYGMSQKVVLLYTSEHLVTECS